MARDESRTSSMAPIPGPVPFKLIAFAAAIGLGAMIGLGALSIVDAANVVKAEASTAEAETETNFMPLFCQIKS